MAEEGPAEDVIQVPAVWVGADEIPVHMSNQFIGLAVALDELVLSFGVFTPPPFLGTEQERRAQAEALTFVPVQAIARFGMNRRRLEELRGVIDQTLDNHDKLFGSST